LKYCIARSNRCDLFFDFSPSTNYFALLASSVIYLFVEKSFGEKSVGHHAYYLLPSMWWLTACRGEPEDQSLSLL
jgi:hypothetical protein